jgi:hypothetical protein
MPKRPIPNKYLRDKKIEYDDVIKGIKRQLEKRYFDFKQLKRQLNDSVWKERR